MKIVIIGMGSAAISIAEILSNQYNYSVIGFIGTDQESKKFKGKRIYKDLPLLGSRKLLKDLKKKDVGGFNVAIGDNYIRETAFYEASNLGLVPINAISKNAFIENNVTIKSGVSIASGAIIQHGALISDNTFIGTGCIVDFDTKVMENCYLGPGSIIGANASIGRNTRINSRAVIEQDIKVGKNQIIKTREVVDKNKKNLIRKYQ